MSQSQPAELPPPRFRRTKTDKWAVVAPVETLETALRSGGVVDVQRKSGDWSKFTVASLGRPFDVDGVAMCYGYGPDDEADPATARSAGPTSAQSPRTASRTPSASGPATGARTARAFPQPEPPPRDDTEPLPEYRGGPDDEWQDGF